LSARIYQLEIEALRAKLRYFIEGSDDEADEGVQRRPRHRFRAIFGVIK